MNSDRIENLTVQQVYDELQNNQIVLIDVRTPQEYMFEHIEGALLFPVAFFSPESLPSQDGKRIVLHCGSGVRSEKVGTRCLASGIDRIAHMKGGFAEWKKAGLAYIGTDMSTGAPKKVSAKV